MEENKKKNGSKWFNILAVIVESLLLLVLSASLVRSCSSINNTGSSQEAPLVVYGEKQNANNNLPHSFVARNESNLIVTVSYYDSFPNSLNYKEVLMPQSEAVIHYGLTGYVYITCDDNYFLAVSDDENILSFNDEMGFNTSYFEGSYINFYNDFSNTLYVDPKANWHPRNNKALYGDVDTSVFNYYETYFSLGDQFKLDYKDSYSNMWNNFQSLCFTAVIIPQGYGFVYWASLYAYAPTSYTHTYPIYVEIATTRVPSTQFTEIDNWRPNPSTGDFFKGLHLGSESGEYRYYDVMNVCPWLQSSLITPIDTSDSFSFRYTDVSVSSVIRPYLLDTKPFKENYVVLSNLDQDWSLWEQFSELLTATLIAILPIANIRLLPFISIGALIIAPMVIMMLALVLRLFKK